MSKVTVLGCGSVGRVAIKTLDSMDTFSEIAVGDIDLKAAKDAAASCKHKASAVKVNASEASSIKEAINGSSVVLNCVGPFYQFGPPILRASIEKGINYVDVCDDFDATQMQLEMDGDAKRAGVSALIGMGSSPGLANLIAKFFSSMLSEVDSVDIYHAHGGEASEGGAVIKHRIHSMEMPIPVFLDGKFKTVRLFEDSGKELEEDTDFPSVGTYHVYAYPHPETITLPKYIKGIKRVSNLGLVLPPRYAELIKSVVKLGITSPEPLDVQGKKVVPLDFAVSFILSQREKLVKEAGLGGPLGCLKIVIKGKAKGKRQAYSVSLSSRGEGMGEGTGIPAALGAALMGEGKIKEKGAFPPEAYMNPLDVFLKAQKVLKSGGKSLPLDVESIGEDGKAKKIDIKELLGF